MHVARQFRLSVSSSDRELSRGGRVKYNADIPVEYHITQYDLEQGALEIQYIEEYFGEFPRKKTAAEIVRRLSDRKHLILIASGPLPDDPGTVVPVSFKVAHESIARKPSRNSSIW